MTATNSQYNTGDNVCGIYDCATCSHRVREKCRGCAQSNAINAALGEGTCAVYDCVVSNNLSSCKECTRPVCYHARSPEMICPIRSKFEKKRNYAHKISDYMSSKKKDVRDTGLVSQKLDKVVNRLPWYLFAIEDFIKYGVVNISSEDLARKVGAKPYLVRRDLSQFGDFGTPSIGYDTLKLREALSTILGIKTEHRVVWVGASRLAAHKVLVPRFQEYNYRIVAIFDKEPKNHPETIDGIKVHNIKNMKEVVDEEKAVGAIIATTTEDAQEVADRLVASGIHGILNLTSRLLALPPNICIRNAGVVAELLALSYYCNSGVDLSDSGPDEE